jgi:hypothetical protein
MMCDTKVILIDAILTCGTLDVVLKAATFVRRDPMRSTS